MDFFATVGNGLGGVARVHDQSGIFYDLDPVKGRMVGGDQDAIERANVLSGGWVVLKFGYVEAPHFGEFGNVRIAVAQFGSSFA